MNGMFQSRLPVLWLALVLLTGCASIPLRTMWEMRGMGPETLTEVDPAEIRAAIMSESLFMDHPNMDEVRLRLSMTLTDESSHDFLFRMEDMRHVYIDRLARPEAGMSWRVYRIHQEDVEDFRRMQSVLDRWLVREEAQPRELEFAVHFVRVEESESFIDALRRMVDEVSGLEQNQNLTADAIAEWERNGLRIRVDLQLFRERGFMQLMRTTRLPFVSTDPS